MDIHQPDQIGIGNPAARADDDDPGTSALGQPAHEPFLVFRIFHQGDQVDHISVAQALVLDALDDLQEVGIVGAGQKHHQRAPGVDRVFFKFEAGSLHSRGDLTFQLLAERFDVVEHARHR
jgi:hypothetical protein